jgi:hypothetical protein
MSIAAPRKPDLALLSATYNRPGLTTGTRQSISGNILKWVAQWNIKGDRWLVEEHQMKWLHLNKFLQLLEILPIGIFIVLPQYTVMTDDDKQIQNVTVIGLLTEAVHRTNSHISSELSGHSFWRPNL